MKKTQDKVNKTFVETFGNTPLAQRLDDIFGEALELRRFVSLKNIKEEAGDLLASTLQLCNECGWDADDLVQATLDKIKYRESQYKSLGRKTNVALLGGAFNPPTKGHIQLAKYVLDTSKTFDEVWLTPCYKHMYNKELASSEDRLAMCELAAAEDGRIKVFDYEIKNELAGETYQLVKRLLDEDFAKDRYDFSIIVGMDNANTFDKWVNYEFLEKMIRFVVVPRKGVEQDRKVTWYLKPPHIYLGSPDTEIMEISSTKVRESIDKPFSNPLHRYVGLKVEKYIIDKDLYWE
jgi:nicotinate-nucleotide adenylyltransferase